MLKANEILEIFEKNGLYGASVSSTNDEYTINIVYEQDIPDNYAALEVVNSHETSVYQEDDAFLGADLNSSTSRATIYLELSDKIASAINEYENREK